MRKFTTVMAVTSGEVSTTDVDMHEVPEPKIRLPSLEGAASLGTRGRDLH